MMSEEQVGSAKPEYTPEQKNKVYLSIVWIVVAASSIVFAGLLSAIIVSMGDKFWVHMNMPKGFLYGIPVLVLSSILLFLSVKFAKQDKIGLTKISLGVVVILGAIFAGCQFSGWGEMADSGKVIRGNIFFGYGAYGSDFYITDNGERIEHDGIQYNLNEQKISDDKYESLRSFAYQICGDKRGYRDTTYNIEGYGAPFHIVQVSNDTIEGGLIEFREGKVYNAQGKELSFSERDDLFKFAFGVYREMPFFFMKGEYGKDFTMVLNDEELEFENRKLFFKERELTEEEISQIKVSVYQGGQEYSIKEGIVYSKGEEVDMSTFETYFDLKGKTYHLKNGVWIKERSELNRVQYREFYSARNTASGFVWAMTVIHFIHLFLGLIFLIVLFGRSMMNKYNSHNQVGIKAVGVFWHFLGVIWIILFCFFQYYR